MQGTQFAVYLGAKTEGSYAGFIAEGNFFAILEAEDGSSHEAFSSELKKLTSSLKSVATLSVFEDHIGQFIKSANLPTSVSFSAGLLVDRKVFLKTLGEGQIYIKRGRDFARLIEGDKSASGICQEGDYLVFTTPRFTTLFDSEDELSRLDFGKSPHDLVEEATPGLKSRDDAGSVALFVRMTAPIIEETVIEEAVEKPAFSGALAGTTSPRLRRPDFFAHFHKTAGQMREGLKQKYQIYGRKKTLTAVVVGVIFVIFIWSVVLSSVRREEAKLQKKITASRQIISGYVEQADEVAFLNLGRSQALLSLARGELEKLKKELGGKKTSEVEKLDAFIRKKEEEILKKETKKAEEFYDLSLEKKDASGDRMYLEGERVSVLDKKGAVYILSLTKKSITARQSSAAKGAQLVALNGDNVFLYRENSGIVTIDGEGKVKKVIENDNEWKKIVDMSFFNNNLYLLDAESDQIYKYTPAEDGFSEKTGYIKSGGADFPTSASLAIDSAVYVGNDERVIKYLAGQPDDFPASFPEKNSSITKVFSNEDLEKVYVWDKPKGALYILGKSGVYERQVTAAILKEASDMAVYKNKAYILEGGKIYTISIE